MSAVYFPGRRNVQDDMPDGRRHRQEIARAVNDLIAGHNNATLQVTLDPNVGSTTVSDPRIGIQTAPLLVPTTANAAAALATTYCVPTQGALVINHANNTQTDRIFQLALIG